MKDKSLEEVFEHLDEIVVKLEETDVSLENSFPKILYFIMV